MITATQLAVQAFGLEPVGQQAKEQGTCICCGAAWQPGDLVTPFRAGSGFNDSRALQPHAAGPKFVCGCCGNFFSKEMMAESQRVMLTPEGAYRIGTQAARAWFLLNPPKGPFAVVFKDAPSAIINQHVIWRTPVSLDPDYWLVQHYRRTMGMRRLRVLEAVRVWREVLGPAYISADAPVKASKRGKANQAPKPRATKVPASPFRSLDPILADPDGGPIRADIRRWAAENDPRSLALLESLNPIEQWAFGPLVFSKPDEVVAPERIDLAGILGRKRGEKAARAAAKAAAKQAEPATAE